MSIFAGINAQGQSGSSAAENWSMGSSSGINQSWDNSFGYNYGYSNSAEQHVSDSWSMASEDAWNRTYGREASAQDVQNARAANDVEAQLWALQAAYNANEAQKNRDFQQYMSNTAYQRAVSDLKKAGLNPMLAVGAMASTPTGATASAGLSSAHKANAYAESVGGSTYRSSSKSHGEGRSSSSSYNYGENKSSGGSYGRNSSTNSAYGYEKSSFSNNVKEIANTAMEILGTNEFLLNSPPVKRNIESNNSDKEKYEKHTKSPGYHTGDIYRGQISNSHSR